MLRKLVTGNQIRNGSLLRGWLRRSVATQVSEVQTKPVSSSSQTTEPVIMDSGKNSGQQAFPPEYRFVYQEFLPTVDSKHRNKLREKLERQDMLQRRANIEIPEFYVGSVLSVVIGDVNAPEKTNRFVGICIQRGGTGLNSWFILRNIVDRQGIEIKYELYCPLLQKIEVLKLEKRLDEELLYLRDALPEYSTFPFDAEPEIRAEGAPVTINPIKVKLRPRPWLERWERKDLKGVEELGLPQRFYDRAKQLSKPWEKYDLMLQYRKTIPAEEQERIFTEVHPQLQQQELRRKLKRRGAREQ
nr:EOG090X0F2L [Leptodora kindtii]